MPSVYFSFTTGISILKHPLIKRNHFIRCLAPMLLSGGFLDSAVESDERFADVFVCGAGEVKWPRVLLYGRI